MLVECSDRWWWRAVCIVIMCVLCVRAAVIVSSPLYPSLSSSIVHPSSPPSIRVAPPLVVNHNANQLMPKPSSLIDNRNVSLPASIGLTSPFLMALTTTSGLSLPVQFALQELNRFKNRLEKLHQTSQSLNDLLADIFSKPASLVHSTNSSLHSSFDQIMSELPMKLPRKLQIFIAQLASGNLNETSAKANNDSIDRQSLAADTSLDLSGANDILTNQFRMANIINNANNNNNNNKIKLAKKKKPITPTASQTNGRCYEPYGCFRITDPFRTILRPINLLPEPPDSIKVAFYLRTRHNPTVAERIVYSDAMKVFQSSQFNPEHKLKLIVHGYLESSEESWEMSSALLNREDCNVISVDWALGATPPYTQAVANTRLVGAIVAHLIQLIQETYPAGYPSTRIHIIGHSLGAHIAGYAGQTIPNLGRITGLDPAEPYFQYTDPIVRLDSTDAKFVDVVHTDVASIISGGFGMNQTCGHVDFYPNGGENQPGCKETPIKNVFDSISKERTVFDGIRRFIGCNHLRSFLLFIEAINSECPFMAYPCTSYEHFQSGRCSTQLYGWVDYPQHCALSSFYAYPPQPRKYVKSGKELLNQTKLEPSTLPSCPIRMGLESEHDYNLNRLSWIKLDHKSEKTAPNVQQHYYLQTSDRASFCQYHYELRLVLLIVQQRLFRSYRSRQFSLDNFVLNGRLTIVLVGSRQRSVKEITLKQHDWLETGRVIDRIAGIHLKEYTLIMSDHNLGKILRVELEWRPSVQAQRSVMVMQSRALRRWWPQLAFLDSASITLLPGMINELQRTLNFTANAALPSIAAVHDVKSQPTVTPAVVEMAPVKENSPPPVLPSLEAILITQLETGERVTFCAQEMEAKTIFQTKNNHKWAVLLTPSKHSLRGYKLEHDSLDRGDIYELCRE